jgi:hypothetical protein
VGSSLVTPKWRIPEPDQPLDPISSLVTTGSVSRLFARNRGVPRATLALDSRAADRGSSHDSPVSEASAVDWLSCSPHDIAVRSNTSAGSAFADGGNTASGKQGIDDVYSSSRGQGSSWLVSCPGSRVRRPVFSNAVTALPMPEPPSSTPFQHAPKTDHDGAGILITSRWNQRSRRVGNPDHHEPEYALCSDETGDSSRH